MKKIIFIVCLLSAVFVGGVSYAQNPYAAPDTFQVRGYTRSKWNVCATTYQNSTRRD